MPRRTVLFIASDTLGERMAGPGIRSWELGRVLSGYFDVTLAVPPLFRTDGEPSEPDFPARAVSCRSTAELRRRAAEADIVVTQGAVVSMFPFLRRIGRPLVVDSCDPFLLASLQQYVHAEMAERLSMHSKYRDAHLTGLLAADFILCASEKQRDYYLGMLSALGRVNPQNHDEDPSLGRLMGVVPYGLPDARPRRREKVLKGVHAGIAEDDRVVLWGGGIWNWLDAQTAVRAMAHVSRRRDDVRLFFMGTTRPNPSVAAMSAVGETIALSQQLGLKDRFVFFNDWVPYAMRENYLLEADIGISLHRSVLETRFAFRTRLLDYYWARLPVVATEGDVLSEEVSRYELGRVVAAGDEEAVAEAILSLVKTPELKDTYRSRFARVTDSYRWSVVAEPLVRFCHEPRLAPDKDYLRRLPSPLAVGAWKIALKEIWTAIKESPLGQWTRNGGTRGSG